MGADFRKNIRLIRERLYLSVKRFAELTGVSSTTIVNIEQGHTGLNVGTMTKLTSFTGLTYQTVSSPEFEIPPNFQKELFNRYKDDIELRDFFTERPKIKDLINDNLINSSFFKEYKKTHEIVEFFEKLGWEINGPSLQNVLKSHDDVEIIAHTTKKNTNLYKRKSK